MPFTNAYLAMVEPKLRIGIMCNNLLLQQWQVACLRKLAEVPGVEFVLVVKNAPQAPVDRSWFQRACRRPWSTLLYRAYRHRFWKPGSMQSNDVSNLLGHLPEVECRTQLKGNTDHFSPADLERIGAFRPDILIRFGFNILGGAILDLPRHGVWSFHHGDEMKYRGGPPGLWEIMARDSVTGAVLQRLTNRLDGGIILRRGWFRTIDHSLKETVDTVLLHSAVWPSLVCRELLAGNGQAAQGTVSTTEAPLYKYPRNGQFLRFLWRQWHNKLKFHRAEFNAHEEWNIGILHQPISSFLNEEGYNTSVQWLPPPAAGQYRADPFGYMSNGQLQVLHERFDQVEGRARIARLRPRQDNNLKRSWTMLDVGQHLSYPYVVEHEGTTYVIPEQAALGRVDLYKVVADNADLERVGCLLEEPLLDPTLFHHEGRWWLFGTKPPLTNVELFIYCSSSFSGPYQPHLLNPVKADIRSARPGGTPFVHAGELWRPAQDSSITYGGRISLNRVLELTPTSFAEETVKHIEPLRGRWSRGLHTISAAGGLTLVDGKRFLTDTSQRSRVRGRKLARIFGRKPGNGKRKS